MNLQILKEKEVPLLSRKRVSLMIKEVASTPSRKEIINHVSKKLNVKAANTVIRHIYPQYGMSDVKVIVHIYYDEKKMKLLEHANLLKKHDLKTEKNEELKAEVPTEKKEEKTDENSSDGKKTQLKNLIQKKNLSKRNLVLIVITMKIQIKTMFQILRRNKNGEEQKKK